MPRHILLYIDHKDDGTHVLYYDDGTVETRDAGWKLIESHNFGRNLVMLDMQKMFNKKYLD